MEESEDPEEIASARLYMGPSGPRNDGEGDPFAVWEIASSPRVLVPAASRNDGEEDPCVLTNEEMLRKAKRLRDAFAMSASGINN